MSGEVDRNSDKTVNGLDYVPGITVPPRTEARQTYEQEYIDNVQEIPIKHQLIEERFTYKDIPVYQDNYIKKAEVETLHRKIEIPKPVYKLNPIEVPQTHIIDKVTERYEDIVKNRIVTKPEYVLQERIIPISKRKVEEVTHKIPRDIYEKQINERIANLSFDQRNEEIMGSSGYDKGKNLFGAGINGLFGQAEPETIDGPRHRHLPKPVEIPMIHYQAEPIERIIERNVPVPVELHVVQEFKCPTLIPIWEEKPVHVKVTRIIEKPVPADAFRNKTLMRMYLRQTRDLDAEAEARWTRNQRSLVGCFDSFSADKYEKRFKMTPEERAAYGLLEEDYKKLTTLDSHGWDQYQAYNATVSGNFLTEGHELLRDQRSSSIRREQADLIWGSTPA